MASSTSLSNLTRELTPEQCELQYNLRQAHSDFPSILKDWQDWSEQTRRDLDFEADLQYGPSTDETLDLFLADTPQPSPLLLFIHGGYWQSGDKRDVSFIARHLVPAGISVAVNNYGLAPQTNLQGMVEQTSRALQWLSSQAGRFHIDPAKIILMGHSAGGHLSAMMLTAYGASENKATGPRVQGAIAISGLFDLQPLLHTTLNDALQLDVEQVQKLSPLSLKKTVKASLYTLVGALETQAFKNQEQVIGAHWPDVQMLPNVDGKHHYTVLDLFNDPDNPWFKCIADIALDE